MKILVAFRSMYENKNLLEIAAQHVKCMGGEIILVTSLIGGTHNGVEDIQHAEKNLDQAKDFLAEKSVACNIHLLIRKFTVGEDIVNYAKEKSCDEIIIGVRSRSKVGKIIFGSTAQYVILHADCPVVTAKYRVK